MSKDFGDRCCFPGFYRVFVSTTGVASSFLDQKSFPKHSLSVVVVYAFFFPVKFYLIRTPHMLRVATDIIGDRPTTVSEGTVSSTELREFSGPHQGPEEKSVSSFQPSLFVYQSFSSSSPSLAQNSVISLFRNSIPPLVALNWRLCIENRVIQNRAIQIVRFQGRLKH